MTLLLGEAQLNVNESQVIAAWGINVTYPYLPRAFQDPKFPVKSLVWSRWFTVIGWHGRKLPTTQPTPDWRPGLAYVKFSTSFCFQTPPKINKPLEPLKITSLYLVKIPISFLLVGLGNIPIERSYPRSSFWILLGTCSKKSSRFLLEENAMTDHMNVMLLAGLSHAYWES